VGKQPSKGSNHIKLRKKGIRQKMGKKEERR